MSAARKRPRSEVEESRAECPFSVNYEVTDDKAQKKQKKRRKQDDEDDDGKKKLFQLSPFAPSGKFKTHETMDLHYNVEPHKKWLEMTRYNSFVLNGTKYFSEGFIYVANDSTIERQKESVEVDSDGVKKAQRRKKSDDDWVARILEIRASDEHHVYARVYWMYWPDELPEGTLDGKKHVRGRQPYHGHNELIASNHMDIINVVSVTLPASVRQWFEENDDEIQDALYWRQAFDFRNLQLSSVERTCKCDQPANPDKTLVGCTNKGCSKWLHEECLLHEALMQTYERLGTDKVHHNPTPEPSSNNITVPLHAKEKLDEETGRPLSPTENGPEEVQQSIDAKLDNASEDTIVKTEEIDIAKSQEEPVVQPPSSADSPAITPPGRSRGRPRKKVNGIDPSSKPYEGLFEASLKMDITPPMVEIRDVREDVPGGDKVWTETLSCLMCGTQIS